MPDNPDNPDEDTRLLDLRTEVAIRAFQNQDRLNTMYREQQLAATGQVSGTPEWTQAEWPYYRAIWTEVAEAINHTNWFWWKFGQYGKPISDAQRDELYIELCDILHFGLSLEFIRNTEPVNKVAEAANLMAWAFGVAEIEAAGVHKLKVEAHLENLVVEAIKQHKFSSLSFAKACAAVNLSFEKLMFMYFGKTALNEFRQHNGYGVGKYTKLWAVGNDPEPREDNTHLVRILNAIYADFGMEPALKLVGTPAFYDLVYTKLAFAYRTRTNK